MPLVINGLEIELTRLVKSFLPLFAKEGESLPLEKGGGEGFSKSVLISMRTLIRSDFVGAASSRDPAAGLPQEKA
jgi:hypothetical protein